MPDGKTHAMLWKLGYIVVIPTTAYLYIYQDLPVSSGFFIGYTMGAIISPDWDLMAITKDESNAIKIPIIGDILFGLSSAYGAIWRNHHRSIWTHGYLVSTAIRMIYLFWWLYLLYYFKFIIYQDWQMWFGIGVFTGMCVADSIHYTADLLVSDYKNNYRKKTKRKPLTTRRKRV